MKKNSKVILPLILILVVLVATTWYSATIIFGTGNDQEPRIKLGLDLAGGVSITYQTVKDDPTPEELSDTIYKLQQRVENYSTEAQVYREGDNRISIEIPGVSDANAILEELGRPGSLSFLNADGEEVLGGTDVADAQAGSRSDNLGRRQWVVQLSLTPEGSTKFADATRANLNRNIAIVYDGQVISNPTVTNVITGGQAEITGMDSFEDAEILASSIRIGSLSLELEELHSRVVGAQLGADALAGSMKAGVIGMILVMLFMILYYRIPGLSASIALFFYCVLMIFAIWLFDITLTLPGIAGIVLSIGMAVDANVIIFARIREEIGAGSSVNTAIKTGFHKALSAILDGNITTLIAAVILALRGSGPVRGFAYTLGIGVVISMVTALAVTRNILYGFHMAGLKDEKFYGKSKPQKTIDFLSKRWIFIGVSGVILIVGLVGLGVNRSRSGEIMNFSLEFMGGSSTIVEFNNDYSIEEISQNIVPVVEGVIGGGDVQTQKIDGTNQVVIKTRTMELAEREAFNQAMLEQFEVEDTSITAENISSTVSAEMKSDAVWALVLSLICMLIYIWFRFKDVRFAGSAVFALLNDVMIVLVFYVLSWTTVGTTFIAVMLTIVGYSINATIVIFDRIRENLAKTPKQTPEVLKDLANQSITQTLSRSINTTLTTFISLFVLWILGVTSIREFSAPLMVGLLAGVFSSVCLTSSIWYMFRTRIGKKA